MVHYDLTGVAAIGDGIAGSVTQNAATPVVANSAGGAGANAPRADRRKVNRPWANQPAARSQPAAAPRPEAAVPSATRAPVRAAENGKDSSDWQEF
jgi:hypothetical protein